MNWIGWLFFVFFVLSCALNVMAAYLLYGFIRRLMEAERLLNEVNETTDTLLRFCETLKKKSLVYYSPEAQQFHKLVVQLAKPLESISKKEG